MARGFILQPTYRIEHGRPVVHLYGVMESGGSFLVRDTRSRPHFWIRADDAAGAREMGAEVVDAAAPRRSLDGAPLARVEVALPGDAPALRDRLTAEGIECLEADVRFAYRYLIERGIRGAVEIDGAVHPESETAWVDAVYEDVGVRPGDWTPELSVLSVDIETDYRTSRVLSIALVGCGASEVLLLTHDDQTCPPDAIACATERWLLDNFVHRVRALDPDVITGWNVVDFDLAMLERRGRRLGVPMTLGRSPEAMRLRPSNSPRATSEALVPGRLVMDGLALVRGAFVKLESYALNGAAKEILGKEKLITGHDRADQILRAFHQDRPHLVAYNRLDAELVLEILDKLHLVELAVERSRLTGMPPDRVDASIASFDFLYLTELARRGLTAPSVQEVPGLESQPGGHVLDPEHGLHRNVLVLDFKSLYPSVIRTFQIDPLGLYRGMEAGADVIVAPNGARFSREPGILPQLLDELFPRREAAKREGNAVASHAIKILMNSFYGVLGTPVCRFASPALVGAITGFGKLLLLWTKERIEGRGLRVLYGDTDSLFVRSGVDDADEAVALGERLVSELDAELAEYVEATWGVVSRMELEFEKLYARMMLPAIRRGTGGARKRYAGLVHAKAPAGSGGPAAGGPTAPEVELIGMEAVRRDWTELARRVQRELYARLFTDRPVDGFLRTTVADLRSGRHDAELVYRKGLRRALDSYTSTTPPHVAAARKMSSKPGRVMYYVMTRNGPEPARERTAPLDHEHYVQKQIRPVAEPVLDQLGLDFDAVVGDEHQLQLF